jgi:N-acetylglutamate synthase-like GNAT family acetyltransferase
MKIRAVKARDRRKMAEYLVNYWKNRGMHQFTVKWALDYLKKGLTFEMKTERFILTNDKGNILGTVALLKYIEHVAEIRDEIWENDVVGSALLKHLISYAKKNNIQKLYSLALKNKIKFYRKHGFKKEGLLRNQFEKGEHVTVMSKFL